jgi:hypothetical protein
MEQDFETDDFVDLLFKIQCPNWYHLEVENKAIGNSSLHHTHKPSIDNGQSPLPTPGLPRSKLAKSILLNSSA